MSTMTTLTPAQRERKNYNDRVRRRNKKFAEATPAQKRVMIAQDVAEQLAIKKLVAERGTYLSLPLSQLRVFDKSKNSEQACEVLKDAKCEVCGIGAVFMSGMLMNDQLTMGNFIGHYGDSHWMRRYLMKHELFDLKQLHMIENAFEGWDKRWDRWSPARGNHACEGSLTEEEAMACQRFNAGINSDRTRLRRVMENLVENNGTFVP